MSPPPAGDDAAVTRPPTIPDGYVACEHPYVDEATGNTWWVLADDAATALKVVLDHDEPRDYFKVSYVVERCVVRAARVGDDLHLSFGAIVECEYTTDEGAVEAWRVVVSDG